MITLEVVFGFQFGNPFKALKFETIFQCLKLEKSFRPPLGDSIFKLKIKQTQNLYIFISNMYEYNRKNVYEYDYI